MKTARGDRFNRHLLTAAAALVVALLFGAIAATQAGAQQPPICDQYPNLPECQAPGEIPGGEPPGEEPPSGVAIPGGPGAGPGGTATAGSGALPFTGYPLTPLLLLLLLLLLAGLTIRAYLAIRDRLRARHVGPPGGAA